MIKCDVGIVNFREVRMGSWFMTIRDEWAPFVSYCA